MAILTDKKPFKYYVDTNNKISHIVTNDNYVVPIKLT